jgi:hypothetical protein
MAVHGLVLAHCVAGARLLLKTDVVVLHAAKQRISAWPMLGTLSPASRAAATTHSSSSLLLTLSLIAIIQDFVRWLLLSL